MSGFPDSVGIHHAGGVPAVAGIPPAGDPREGAPGPAPKGGNGPHINPLYITRNEFMLLRPR